MQNVSKQAVLAEKHAFRRSKNEENLYELKDYIFTR